MAFPDSLAATPSLNQQVDLAHHPKFLPSKKVFLKSFELLNLTIVKSCRGEFDCALQIAA